MLSVSPSLVFHTELAILELTSKQAFYPITLQCQSPPLNSKFYFPTDPEHNFHKAGIET